MLRHGCTPQGRHRATARGSRSGAGRGRGGVWTLAEAEAEVALIGAQRVERVIALPLVALLRDIDAGAQAAPD